MADTRYYEGMFLVESHWGIKSKDEVIETITKWIEKYEGKVIRIEKWLEKKLAYSIKIERTKHKKGVYFLSILELPPKAIKEIYQEVKLNTRFLRAMLMQKEKEEIDKIFLKFPTLEQWRRIITKGGDYFEQVSQLFAEKAKVEAKARAEAEADAQKILEDRRKGKVIASFDEEKDFEAMKKKEKEKEKEKEKKKKKESPKDK